MKKLMRNEAGSVLVMAAAGITLLATLAAVAIEYSRFSSVNSKFASTLDNALLAAATARGSEEQANQIANNFFQANFGIEMQNLGFKLSSLSVEKQDNYRWTIQADGGYSPLIGDLIGLDTLELSHTARVIWDTSTNIEVVFAIDTSASMCMDIERSQIQDGSFIQKFSPDPDCKKLTSLKEALTYVLREGFAPIEANNSEPLFKVGIVPFNHKVNLPVKPNGNNVPAPLMNAEFTGGDKAYYDNLADAERIFPVVPLTEIKTPAQLDTLVGKVNAITQDPQGLGWTRSNIGLLTAGLMLDPSYTGSFGGAAPRSFGGDVEKVVVLMTDGANMGCCYAAYPEGNFTNQFLYLYEPDNAHMEGLANYPHLQPWAAKYQIQQAGLCTTMKDAGYTIYTVAFDVNDNDPGGREIKRVLKGCASNQQFFFDVGSPQELKTAYEVIARSFVRLRIDQ
jgi:Flp pilus assembly protein TadG